MDRSQQLIRRRLGRLLSKGLERVTGSAPVLVPEYPLRLGPQWGWAGPVMEGVAERLARDLDGYRDAVADICELADWAQRIPRRQTAPSEPCWENDYWGSLDALMQCAALRRRNPARYVEIGSGFSTLFARRAVTDFELRTKIVSIDPHPRTDVVDGCDEVIRAPLEAAGLEVFQRLEPGDVVLFDGSHVALMGTDTTFFHLEVVPRLAPGVLVGVDDIFLPWDYPPTWEGRIYGEQYLVAAYLLGGGAGWDIRFPGWWLVEHSPLAPAFASLWPVVENRFGRRAGSFWFERV